MNEKKQENIETLKEIIVKSTNWMDKKEWTWAARYDHLVDMAFGMQIAAGICLYYELHPEVDPCVEICQMAVYDVIEDVLAEAKKKDSN